MEAWTDDIPICRSAGIGTVNNEIYRKDGRRVEMHPMRCRSAELTNLAAIPYHNFSSCLPELEINRVLHI